MLGVVRCSKEPEPAPEPAPKRKMSYISMAPPWAKTNTTVGGPWQVPKGTTGADLAAHARSMMPPATGAATLCGKHLEAFYAKHDPGTDKSETVAGLCAFIVAKRCSVDDFLRLYDDPLRDKYGQSMSEFLDGTGKAVVPPKIRMPPR